MSAETKIESQVVSKRRVSDHGEVYTAKREVDAMLNLVKHECERIDSRFLEPACGTGNFLSEIFTRKLEVITLRYSKSQIEFERNAVIAAGSIYGVDILLDNVLACRERLTNIFAQKYESLFKKEHQKKCIEVIQFVFSQNILLGDALTLRTIDKKGQLAEPIVFAEWAAVNGSMIKRRDFIYSDLVDRASHREMPLFSDLDEEAYIPEPIRDYPLTHYLEMGNAT